ncbi:DUF4190 domain-containing protein [Cellulomonas fimi]|uniref:DUF4190 domain-containing protein n=1 Tax=Cellulomonas fimi TaxID=1708 RepID=A0A7Y0LZ09_CELFI|nr:DUF4190 domain-containing protein [Cellulomonas fimi]NMR20710.1 DUF4190 domain-containing protein [Cellulomonas fimi]
MSDPNAPQDPYAAGREPEQPGTSGGSTPRDTPPAYGSQPPPYGSPPPAYGSQPPAYGSQPPAYGSQPPAYGSQPPAYGSQPQYGAGDYYGGPGTYPKNSLAVWSLVLALVGFFICSFFTGIPAIIVGNKAKRAAAEGQANNPGLATAGIVIGWIVTVLGVLVAIGVIALLASGNWDSTMNYDSGF